MCRFEASGSVQDRYRENWSYLEGKSISSLQRVYNPQLVMGDPHWGLGYDKSNQSWPSDHKLENKAVKPKATTNIQS